MHSSCPRAFVLCLLSLVALCVPANALPTTEKGEWTLSQSVLPHHVEFSLRGSDADGNHFNSSSTWEVADLHGLDWSNQTKHDVHFTVNRDAGSLDCDGFVHDGEGAGLFKFQPDARYVQEMSSLGFGDVINERLLAFAIHDVSLEFARQMKSAAIADLDAAKLIAFRIHGVSLQFIHDIRAAGLHADDANKLIAFRIHGVTPEFVEAVRAAGIKDADADKLIAFRIHGVSPEFVSDIGRLGYSHPDPDKLIAMRIHGVTPQYIQTLRSRGVQNLTIDQLISLRIQGIE